MEEIEKWMYQWTRVGIAVGWGRLEVGGKRDEEQSPLLG